jgi:hypothetical protein
MAIQVFRIILDRSLCLYAALLTRISIRPNRRARPNSARGPRGVQGRFRRHALDAGRAECVKNGVGSLPTSRHRLVVGR